MPSKKSKPRAKASKNRSKARRRPRPGARPAARRPKAGAGRRAKPAARPAARPRTGQARPAAAGRPAAPRPTAAARPAGPPIDFLAWLRRQNAQFTTQKHAEAFTAQEVAAAVRVTGYDLAKVVVLKADERFALAVVPAPLRVDLKAARQVLGAKKVALAREDEFESLFPGCDRGAMPPFGGLWGLPTYVDESLAGHAQIVFNAGSHIETVSMPYREYERLARPTRARIAETPA